MISENVMAIRRNKKPFPIGKVIIYSILIIYTVWLFAPMLTILVTSLTSSEQINSSLSFVWLPNITFEAYTAVFTQDQYMMDLGIPGLLLGFLNTMWITLVPLIGSLFVSGVSAYVYAKYKFKGRKHLFTMSVITMTFPLGAFSVITYVFYSWIGWTDSPLPLIIPGLFGHCSTMFFLRMYFDSIPDGLLESAKMDGAGFWGIFWKIMFPLAKPAFIAQFIFGFVGGYNNYMGALLYLGNNQKFVTLQLVLSGTRTFFNGDGMQNIWCAAAIMGMLPLIILYIFLQRYFIEGIAMGGIKE